MKKKITDFRDLIGSSHWGNVGVRSWKKPTVPRFSTWTRSLFVGEESQGPPQP